MNRQCTEDAQSSENILYDTTVGDTCHYILVKTHRIDNTKSVP
jgi:hypothetical protein